MSQTNGFSQNAAMYATSAAHAETADLELALDKLGDLDGRALLDVATGTGHTAFFFATRLAHVFAVDINDEMLAVAQEAADQQSLACRFLKGFANDLPFDDETFDIVTTRLAAHHFESPGDFLSEAFRVLKPGGQVLVVDNVVPDNDPSSAAWINEFEKERDPSHAACLTTSQWRELLGEAGLTEIDMQDYPKDLDFDLWAKRMSIVGADADRLWEKLCQAPQPVLAYLQPAPENGRWLTLHRMVAVGRKPRP